MSLAANIKNNPETRSNAVAGLLVGAVVLVLGFGSGIGAVFSRHTAYSASASASPTSRAAAAAPALGAAGTATAADGAGSTMLLAQPTAVSAPHSSSAPVSTRSTGSAVAAPTVMARSTTPSATSASSASSSASSASAPAPSSTCSGQTVAAAMASPFVMHVDHGHLEESPSQQAGDIANPDQYTKTHTVLIENMTAPAIALGLASFDGLDPFVMHVDHGHLEESPAQQAGDLLDVSQYVKTHTVLFENMTAPAADSATGSSGC